nr:transporter substrate-binding domain-containing protein [Lachnospiraceae bacterium]
MKDRKKGMIRKRRMIALFAAMTLTAFSLGGCGKKEADSLTVEAGKLSVGLEIGYPPMEYFDEDGATPIGFDVELAAALADELGLSLNLVDTAWDGIFAGVDAKKYDVIISCVSYTADRDQNYALTKPYIANAPVLVVP